MTHFDRTPKDIIEYIRRFTGPEQIYEVSYAVNIPRERPDDVIIFQNAGVNIYEPFYFAESKDSQLALKYVRTNSEYFRIKLKKIITRAGSNLGIIVDGNVPCLIFRITNFFPTFESFRERVIDNITTIMSRKMGPKRLKIEAINEDK